MRCLRHFGVWPSPSWNPSPGLNTPMAKWDIQLVGSEHLREIQYRDDHANLCLGHETLRLGTGCQPRPLYECAG